MKEKDEEQCCYCIWLLETEEHEMCGHPCHLQPVCCTDLACGDFETE